MNGSPQHPFGAYGYLAQQRPQQQGVPDMRDQIAQQIMGQPAQNVTQGASQMIAGAGMGLRDFMAQANNQFPTAPAASGVPNPAMPTMQNKNLGALFGLGPKGGLF